MPFTPIWSFSETLSGPCVRYLIHLESRDALLFYDLSLAALSSHLFIASLKDVVCFMKPLVPELGRYGYGSTLSSILAAKSSFVS
jgi:hypothetical protein